MSTPETDHRNRQPWRETDHRRLPDLYFRFLVLRKQEEDGQARCTAAWCSENNENCLAIRNDSDGHGKMTKFLNENATH